MQFDKLKNLVKKRRKWLMYEYNLVLYECNWYTYQGGDENV